MQFQLGIVLFWRAVSEEDLLDLLECFPVGEGFILSLEETLEEIYIRYILFKPYIFMSFSLQ